MKSAHYSNWTKHDYNTPGKMLAVYVLLKSYWASFTYAEKNF